MTEFTAGGRGLIVLGADGCQVNHPYWGMVIYPSPTVNFLGGCIPHSPMIDACGGFYIFLLCMRACNYSKRH